MCHAALESTGLCSAGRAVTRKATRQVRPRSPTPSPFNQVLKVIADELLGVKQIRGLKTQENPEIQRLWKKFQQVLSLSEKDRRAVIRLVNSLVSAKAATRG
jgi:hypothetical protein